MDAQELTEMIAYIRASLEYSVVGLTVQEMQTLNQRLDSDSYRAAQAVVDFFKAKREQEA